MSPLDVSVPVTTKSPLMIEGAAEERIGRFCCCAVVAAAGAAGGAVSLLLLENMASSLDEFARISHDVVIPDFVVNVRASAASRRSEFSDRRALRYSGSNMH